MRASPRQTLVFVHGFAMDGRQWAPQVEAFRGSHRVLTLDLPGFGPKGLDSGEVYPAEQLVRALEAASADRVHLIAADYGCAVAIDFALRYPNRVRSITLAGPMLLGRRTGLDAWSRCMKLTAAGDCTTALEVWLYNPLYDGVRVSEDLFETCRTIAFDYGGTHWTGGLKVKWFVPDPAPRLGGIGAPALILSGENDDPTFRALAELYAKALPHARLERIARSGHLPNLERPESFNEALASFLASFQENG